jgi:anti-anti-sigma regulatory factor
MDRIVGTGSGVSGRGHYGHEQPTRAEALVRLSEFPLMGALDDVEFSLAAALEKGPLTIAIDMSRLSHLSPTTVAALLWIKRCSTARGIDVVLRNPSPTTVDMMQRTGLLGLLTVEAPPDAGAELGSGRTVAFRRT